MERATLVDALSDLFVRIDGIRSGPSRRFRRLKNRGSSSAPQ